MTMTPEAKNIFLDRYLTPIAVLVGAVLIAAALYFGDGAPRTAIAPSPEPAAEVDIRNVKEGTGPVVGNPNAPVTMAVWVDFQCRFCKMFETTALAEVHRTYVANGQVRILYKDFQFLGPASVEAAVYSRAVWEAYPDRWHEWFAQMFEGAEESAPSTASMDRIASSLGLDVARITELRASKEGEYLAAIEADMVEGQSFGVAGAPGTIIGKQLIPGALPFADIKAAIDAELN